MIDYWAPPEASFIKEQYRKRITELSSIMMTLLLADGSGHDLNRSLLTSCAWILGDVAIDGRVACDDDRDRYDPGHDEEDEDENTSWPVVRQIVKATTC